MMHRPIVLPLKRPRGVCGSLKKEPFNEELSIALQDVRDLRNYLSEALDQSSAESQVGDKPMYNALTYIYTICT